MFIQPIKSTDRPPSTHKRIYKPGAKFKTMNQLVKWIDKQGFVFFRGGTRALHHGWFRSYQFGFILWNLRAGNIRKAVKI